MSIIRTPEPGEATGLAAEQYAEDERDLGYVASHTRVMAVNPEATAAFRALVKAVVADLGLRRYELVTLAAARAIGSDACLLAHGRKSLKVFDEDQLTRIARDYRDADLSPAEIEMMAFAERLSGDSASMTEADASRLRAHGFSDREIVDIALAAGARNYFSRALHRDIRSARPRRHALRSCPCSPRRPAPGGPPPRRITSARRTTTARGRSSRVSGGHRGPDRRTTCRDSSPRSPPPAPPRSRSSAASRSPRSTC
ncbi:peroxidase [Agromyces protaetiae]|uniref:Peroxidase n=1 Tax=Agromyces protaetiae TaxID=2509455 RepID=A0A4V0YH56_9MICO|nr:carboxymuconolactone decarboxylase family protein [Agromyces protaetiae]QAY73541.1 peroxidase [Agromyces protaetiae]